MGGPARSKMPSTKRLVCLANSRKLHDRCVAGKEWNGTEAGNWVRPISAREGGAVSERERRYEDGSDPQLLDVMDVPVLQPRSEDYQTENWLLDPMRRWKKADRLSPADLPALTDPVAPLWIDGHSTYNGLNDKIPIATTGPVRESLRLLRVDRLRLEVCRPGEAFGNDKRRVQGRFRHADRKYALWVTDPDYERTYLAKPDGTYDLGGCYVTVSLGEPYQDAYYKLIAAIIAAT